jgi:TolA-binding protein
MKRSLACIIIIGLCCSAAAAQEQKGSALTEWLKGLQNKIAQIAPKKVLPRSTGVAGVRGAKEGPSTKLYWKGKKGEEAVSEEELAEFKEGLDLAAKGDSAGAIRELEEFLKQHMDSALIPDAKKTLDMVKAEGK